MDETMSRYGEEAKALFENGYNCSQAVFLVFCEQYGLSRETAARLASSFGGGMGRLREVCGAVSGMLMAIGLAKGYSDVENKQLKADHYALVQKLAGRFRERNGSIICRELLGLSVQSESPVPQDRTPEYYQKRPCGELIRMAADLAAEEIFS